LKVKKKHPLILAGGLDKENIRKAIEAVRPCAVDINSRCRNLAREKRPLQDQGDHGNHTGNGYG